LADTPSAAAKDHAVGAAGRKVDGAGFERLSALVRAGEAGRVEGVGLTLVLRQLRLGDDQPQRLFRGRAVAEPQGGRLCERGAHASGEQRQDASHSAQRGLAVVSAHLELPSDGQLPMETSHRDDDETNDLAHDLMRRLMRRLGPAVSPRAFRPLIAANS
jgi:hypothetical protein